MTAIDTSRLVEPAFTKSPARTAMRVLFGGPINTLATIAVGIFLLVAIFGPVIRPYDPLAQNFMAISQYPSAAHWLGTDQFGRDVLSRIIDGSRTSLLYGLLAPTIAMLIGTTLGVVAGFFGGVVDRVIVRVIDLLLAFPELLLAIIIASAIGGGFWNVLFVMSMAFIPSFARLSRATTLSVRQEPYIEAAVSMGVRTPVIIFRHVVPNMIAPVLLIMTLLVGAAIRVEATLSFLGIGTQPPQASWGNVMKDSLTNIFGSPWPLIGAGLSITLVILSFNILGDALRDVLDPEGAE